MKHGRLDGLPLVGMTKMVKLSNKTATQLQMMADFFTQNRTAMLYCTTNDDGVYLSFITADKEDAEVFLGYTSDQIAKNLRDFLEKHA